MLQTFVSKAKTANDFQEQINMLNSKLDKVAKNLTYFDFYNISSVVTEKNNFSTQVTNLTPNSSLVINCEPFFLNDEYYNTGDIVFKTSSGTIAHIKAQTGGIYYPKKISKDGNSFSISYQYSSSQPELNSSPEVSINEEAEFAKEITFTGLEPNASSSIYGLWGSYNLLNHFNAYTKDGIIIQPYIKFYFVDGNFQEEVCIDYTIQLNEAQTEWTVSFLEASSINTDSIWMKVK